MGISFMGQEAEVGKPCSAGETPGAGEGLIKES